MARPALVFCIALGVIACRAPAPTTPSQSATAANTTADASAKKTYTPEAYALVRWDANLYRTDAHGVKIPVVRYTYASEAWRNDGCGVEEPPGPGPATIPELQVRGFSFRILGEDEEFVEIETLGTERYSHCHPGWPSLGGLRVQLWVRHTDLLPVIAKPVRLEYEDGTSVRLAAGKGLRHIEGDTYEVLADPYPYMFAREVGGQPLRVRLRSDEVSDRWHARHAPDADRRTSVWIDCAVAPDAKNHADEARSPSGCRLRRWQDEHAGRLEPWYEIGGGRVFAGRVLSAAGTGSGDARSFELGCLEIEAKLSERPLDTPLAPLGVQPGPSPTLPCGSPWGFAGSTDTAMALYWPDGQAAGTVEPGLIGAVLAPLREDVYLHRAETWDRRCKEVLVRPDAMTLRGHPPRENTLSLCFDS